MNSVKAPLPICKITRWTNRLIGMLALIVALPLLTTAQQVITTTVTSGPNVIAITSYQGNIYYSTAAPGAIYKLTAGGTATLIAGTPGGGATGDTINAHPAATSVSIAPGINGLAFDANGNLFFTEPGNRQIREILAPVDAPGAIIATFDNSSLVYPGALTIRGGFMYWADEWQHTVFRADMTTGAQTRIAGTIDNSNFYPAGGYSGDNGPGNQAQLNHPRGLAFDLAGNLLIADTSNNVIRRVDGSGTITTVAGTGTAGFSGDGGSAISAKLFLPSAVVVDSGGNILIADTSNNRVRLVSLSSTISTVAGNGSAKFAGDGAQATSASLAFPASLVIDALGHLVIADSQNNRVRTVSGGVISTLAGNTQPVYSGDGVAHGNSLNSPEYLVFDSAGNMFFSDTFNSRIRRVDAVTKAITTVAGNGIAGQSGMGAAATSAQIGCPAGLAFGKNGSLLIADPCAELVFKVAPSADGLVKGRSDELITIFAGGGQGSPSSNNLQLTATDLALGAPWSIAVESDDTLVLGTLQADFNGGYILAINGADGSFTTRGSFGQVPLSLVAGPGGLTLVGSSSSDNEPISYASGPLDGNLWAGWTDFGLSGSFDEFIGGLAFDGFGNLYASTSQTTDTVFQFTTTQVLVYAGSRTQGLGGDGGTPTAALLNQPLGVAVDPGGNVFIADTGNNVIRKVGAGTVTPPPGVPTLISTPANLTNQSSADFSFSDVDPTVSTFICTIDSATNPCTSPVSYSNLADGSHTFSVWGKRADGTASAPASYTWIVDTIPPPVPTIDSHPSNPSNTSNAAFTFSDAEATARLSCSLDSVRVACTSPIIYPGLSDGSHTFSIFATDAAGNQSAANTFAWTVATIAPPAPSINSAPAALTNQPVASVSFSDTQAGVNFLCQIDGLGFSPCVSPNNYVGLPDGPHVFAVIASDPQSGRSSATTSYSWTLDTTPPNVGYIGAPDITVIPSPSYFDFRSSATDLAFFQCSVDGGAYAPCTPPLNLPITTPGTHYFSVEGVDKAGNVGAPAPYSWTVSYCHCGISGDYANPSIGQSPSTQSLLWGVTAVPNDAAQQTILTVTDTSNKIVFSATLPITTTWQFSPDGNRFLYHYVIPSTGQDNVTVLDLTVSPPRQILSRTVPASSDLLQFSPSGAYLMIAAVVGSSRTSITLYRVAGVSQAVQVHEDEFSYTVSGPVGEDPVGVAGFGFNTTAGTGVQEPEVSFLYYYNSGQTSFNWVVVNLEKKRPVISSTSFAISAYFQFNPCGDVVAFIQQTSPNEEEVDLFSTVDGSHIGAVSFPLSNFAITSTTTQELVQLPNQSPIVAANDPTCAPNTPAGNNVSVAAIAQDNTNPVTVTFSDVTQTGGTGVSKSSTGNAAPGNFELGNPPTYYDVSTSANFSGQITLCFDYSGITFTGSPRLFHFVNGAWVDVTTTVDTTNLIICGTTSSLSPFAIFQTDQAPAITSNNSAVFNSGAIGSFVATSTGAPTPTFTTSGALPPGVTFTDNGDGSAFFTGIPTSGGLYPLTLTASNKVGTVSQSFTLTVNQTPTITSANAATFTVGSTAAFTVAATGFPAPAFAENGALPGGVTFNASTGSLSGTPTTSGTFSIAFTATNTAGAATQSFMLAVDQVPAITSADTVAFTAGVPGSFTVLAAGFPISSLTQSGVLPAGVSFVDNRNGSATLSGTATAFGTFTTIITATNGVGSPASQSFTLTVAPAVLAGLNVAPTAIDFGNVHFGRLESREVKVHNSGTAPISISKIFLTLGQNTVRDDFFFHSFCKTSLEPGKSCTIDVFYFADDRGPHTATLTIVDNSSNSPQTVILAGTAIR